MLLRISSLWSLTVLAMAVSTGPLGAAELSVEEFRSQLLAKCRIAATATRKCSADSVIRYTAPRFPEQSGTNYARFGYHGERSYAVIGGESYGDYLADHPDGFAGDAPTSRFVAVIAPDLSFLLKRPSDGAAYFASELAARGDPIHDHIDMQVFSAGGDFRAPYSFGFLDFSRRLESDDFVIESLRKLDGSRYEFDFGFKDSRRVYSGTVTCDLELGGIISADIQGKEGETPFRQTMQADYQSPSDGLPIARNVVAEFSVDGTLREKVETEILRFSWEPPESRVFEIQSYGIHAAAPPSPSRLPRIITVVTIVILILSFVAGVWRKPQTTESNASEMTESETTNSQ